MKIRSWGLKGDISEEATLALKYDLAKGVVNLLALYMPDIRKRSDCSKAMATTIISYGTGIYNLNQVNPNDPTAFYQIMINGTHYFIQSSRDVLYGCLTNQLSSKWLNALDAILSVIGWVNAVNSAVNTVAIAYHLATAKPALDTCFLITSGKISKCAVAPSLVGTRWRFITGCGDGLLFQFYAGSQDWSQTGYSIYLKYPIHIDTQTGIVDCFIEYTGTLTSQTEMSGTFKMVLAPGVCSGSCPTSGSFTATKVF